MDGGVQKWRSGVGRVVCCCEKGEAGSTQWGGAMHGAGVVLSQTPLRGKLMLACISHSAMTLEIKETD